MHGENLEAEEKTPRVQKNKSIILRVKHHTEMKSLSTANSIVAAVKTWTAFVPSVEVTKVAPPSTFRFGEFAYTAPALEPVATERRAATAAFHVEFSTMSGVVERGAFVLVAVQTLGLLAAVLVSPAKIPLRRALAGRLRAAPTVPALEARTTFVGAAAPVPFFRALLTAAVPVNASHIRLARVPVPTGLPFVAGVELSLRIFFAIALDLFFSKMSNEIACQPFWYVGKLYRLKRN